MSQLTVFQFVVLCAGIFAILIQLSAGNTNGVPNDPKICDFRTDHGGSSGGRTEGDFEVVLMKDGSEVSCYEPGELTTVRVRVNSTSTKVHVIKGLLIGLMRESFYKKPKLPSGMTQVPTSVCGSAKRLYSHSRLLYTSGIDLPFNFTNISSITFNTTVVFSYAEYIENRKTTFHKCVKPTPTPTPSPTPPPRTNCELCETEINGLKCPINTTRYHMKMNLTEDGTKYICTSEGTIPHSEFPTQCTLSIDCKKDENSYCSTEQVRIENCSIEEKKRLRQFQCTSVDGTSRITIRPRVPIRKSKDYRCDPAKLLS